MIVNLWDTLRIPDGVFPFKLPKVCLFAWLRGGRGRARFRIEIVRTDNNTRIGQPRNFEFDFANPNVSVYGRFMLSEVVFPAPGRYTVEFFCDDEFFDDQVINILSPEVADGSG